MPAVECENFGHVNLMSFMSGTQKLRRGASFVRRAISGSGSSDANLRLCLILRGEILLSEIGLI